MRPQALALGALVTAVVLVALIAGARPVEREPLAPGPTPIGGVVQEEVGVRAPG